MKLTWASIYGNYDAGYEHCYCKEYPTITALCENKRISNKYKIYLNKVLIGILPRSLCYDSKCIFRLVI